MSSASNAGFSLVEIAIIAAFVGIVGLLGYTYYDKLQTIKADDAAVSQAVIAPVVSTLPAITSPADLMSAENTLDNTTIGGMSDNAQLDSQTVNF